MQRRPQPAANAARWSSRGYGGYGGAPCRAGGALGAALDAARRSCGAGGGASAGGWGAGAVPARRNGDEGGAGTGAQLRAPRGGADAAGEEGRAHALRAC